GPREGNRHEDQRVESLADDRRSDRPGPKPATLGSALHVSEDVGVGELADDVRRERGEEEAPRRAEDVLVRRLVLLPEVGGRKMDRSLDRAESDEVARKPQPDDAASGADPVHLGEHITKDVREREDDEPGREDTARDLDELHGDDVRDDQSADEEPGHDDEAPRVRHPMSSRASSISSSVIESGGVALM